MIPAVACKAVACIDPWVYAISHPKYRYKRIYFLQQYKLISFSTIYAQFCNTLMIVTTFLLVKSTLKKSK